MAKNSLGFQPAYHCEFCGVGAPDPHLHGCPMENTLEAQARELRAAMRALGTALLATPPGRFMLWLVDQLAKRLPA
jgi:hypothetical protein